MHKGVPIFHWLEPFPSRNQPIRKTKPRKPPRRRLVLEELEDRCLLTIDPTFPIHFPEVLSADELLADPLSGPERASAEDSSSPENAAPANTSSDTGGGVGCRRVRPRPVTRGQRRGRQQGPPSRRPDQSLLEAMAAGSRQVAGAASPLPAGTQPAPSATDLPVPLVTPAASAPDSPGAGEAPVDGNAVMQSFLANGLRFETNVGQFDSPIDFVARGAGYSVALTPTGLVLATQPAGDADGSEAVAVGMEIVGGNPHAEAVGEGLLPGITNYLSSDPALNHTGIASYGQVRYREVYGGSLRLVAPGRGGRGPGSRG